MGWFNCCGKRNNEEKGGQDLKLMANTHVGKVQPDFVKTIAPVAPVDSPKEASKVASVCAPLAPVDEPKEASKVVSVCAPVERIPSDQNSAPPDIQAQTFTLEELTTAANNFSADCLIGEGGFGPVYKGQLENGQVVAIKQLNQNGLQGNREFLVEALMLSLLHHENLVNLIGYCADGEQRLLVYEFMPLGSLEDHLHDLPDDKEALDWSTRMKIAAGAAKGLEYLHDMANPPVIYRDLKASNILLDDSFHPKLSDFGLAKLGPVGDKTHVSTRVMGTYGYCAPEYAMTGQLTVKSDVYSFGVVLLELITGRKAIDQSRPAGEHNLVAWARPLFKDRSKFSQMADPKLRGRFAVRALFQALAVAAMCLHEQAASRPSIADVVTALNFLASQTCEEQVSSNPTSDVTNFGSRPAPPSDGAPLQQSEVSNVTAMSESVGGVSPCTGTGESKGAELQHKSRNDTWRTLNKTKEDRERAVAEARLWGEALREKRGKVS